MVSCMRPLVTQSEADGLSCAFVCLKNRGNVPSSAAAYGICAIMIVNASQLVMSAMITPRFITQPPHGPTTFARIGALDGFSNAARCPCDM